MRAAAIVAVLIVLAVLPAAPATAWVEEVSRVAGPDRVGTSVEASVEGFDTASTVVLTRADDFADALTAGPLARLEGAPLLLTGQSALPLGVVSEIQRLGAVRAIVVGGTAVIETTVVEELTDLGLDVERVAGADRFATASAVATRVGAPSGEVVITLGAGDIWKVGPALLERLESAGAPRANPVPYVDEGPLLRPDALDAERPSVAVDGRMIETAAFSAEEIGVDAELMQFKSGGDQFGVGNDLVRGKDAGPGDGRNVHVAPPLARLTITTHCAPKVKVSGAITSCGAPGVGGAGVR